MANLRRRSGKHPLRAARSDQRRELRQSSDRLALQDRHSRRAGRLQPRDDAADDWRRALRDGRLAARRRSSRRGDRRAAVDLIDFTPAIKAEALKVASRYKLGPLFTPPIVRGEGGKVGMVYVPNGANWPGGSYDPETGIVYVHSNTLTRLISLVHDEKRSDMDYINGAGGGDTGSGLTVQGLPLVKPPWGRITAIDLNKGEMGWQIPHGETLDTV